jgi:hypothetical protein
VDKATLLLGIFQQLAAEKATQRQDVNQHLAEDIITHLLGFTLQLQEEKPMFLLRTVRQLVEDSIIERVVQEPLSQVEHQMIHATMEQR